MQNIKSNIMDKILKYEDVEPFKTFKRKLLEEGKIFEEEVKSPTPHPFIIYLKGKEGKEEIYKDNFFTNYLILALDFMQKNAERCEYMVSTYLNPKEETRILVLEFNKGKIHRRFVELKSLPNMFVEAIKQLPLYYY